MDTVLPSHSARSKKNPEAVLTPMNIVAENTIDECNQIVHKDHMTHNQSQMWEVGMSVNSRVDKDELIPCRFWYAL